MKYFTILAIMLAVSCSTPEGKEFRKERAKMRRAERLAERRLGSTSYDVDVINDTLLLILPDGGNHAIKPYVIDLRHLDRSIIDDQKIVVPNNRKNHIEYHEK